MHIIRIKGREHLLKTPESFQLQSIIIYFFFQFFCSLQLSLFFSQNKFLQGLSFLKSRETAFTFSVSFVPNSLRDFCLVIFRTVQLSKPECTWGVNIYFKKSIHE